jgi:CBS-domain-containing membrane protein
MDRHKLANGTHGPFEKTPPSLAHMRLEWLLKHYPARVVWAVYVCINGFITIGLLALLALVTGSPFVFPSLGPTAYLFFFSPLAEASSPRNTILGHAIGLICGYGAFVLAVASSPPFGMHPGVHGPRVLAAALSLSATGALMALFRVSHPPAGATTLIVSLGIISQPKELVIIEIAVILLTAQALAINRLAGIPFPLWRDRNPADMSDMAGRGFPKQNE